MRILIVLVTLLVSVSFAAAQMSRGPKAAEMPHASKSPPRGVAAAQIPIPVGSQEDTPTK